ncbi:NADH-quinone oxidoreductase subunit C [Candidatus Bathyarchaeota archaeon]|nr:MAG: NADH-quinone oxidoreductase subunit C [Candidatus Bathyarchaeota archaeon]
MSKCPLPVTPPKYFIIRRSEANYLLAEVPKEKYVEIALWLKSLGYDRLLTVSAIDWIDKGLFEVYFLLYSRKYHSYVKVATYIPREKPDIPTLSNIWPNASFHEREVCELFGITFSGRKLKPLFVEGWAGPPPFRKDFDWREYVREAYDIT